MSCSCPFRCSSVHSTTSDTSSLRNDLDWGVAPSEAPSSHTANAAQALRGDAVSLWDVSSVFSTECFPRFWQERRAVEKIDSRPSNSHSQVLRHAFVAALRRSEAAPKRFAILKTCTLVHQKLRSAGPRPFLRSPAPLSRRCFSCRMQCPRHQARRRSTALSPCCSRPIDGTQLRRCRMRVAVCLDHQRMWVQCARACGWYEPGRCPTLGFGPLIRGCLLPIEVVPRLLRP
ncbi:uncharacterized protein C8Q71DRAFT_362409 [Rhodofomes roseus]|uniref:Uncharacterized protein n=1 Tax=Rhodofomes roseus TaxID=34475 RepID=A0ABQ8K349_9APHY|nr:uncharacterized protein C8Q71DRAFT_362409 [Rhodofomes roseus]KAH9830667.1 hypothetical protein C8Q71DRAFT_362409 [Rhodofomes roseus]